DALEDFEVAEALVHVDHADAGRLAHRVQSLPRSDAAAYRHDRYADRHFQNRTEYGIHTGATPQRLATHPCLLLPHASATRSTRSTRPPCSSSSMHSSGTCARWPNSPERRACACAPTPKPTNARP